MHVAATYVAGGLCRDMSVSCGTRSRYCLLRKWYGMVCHLAEQPVAPLPCNAVNVSFLYLVFFRRDVFVFHQKGRFFGDPKISFFRVFCDHARRARFQGSGLT